MAWKFKSEVHGDNRFALYTDDLVYCRYDSLEAVAASVATLYDGYEERRGELLLQAHELQCEMHDLQTIKEVLE